MYFFYKIKDQNNIFYLSNYTSIIKNVKKEKEKENQMGLPLSSTWPAP